MIDRSPVPHAMRSAVRLLCSKDSSASGDTLVRNPSERDAAEQKPQPIKPGHWRNRYFVCVSDPIWVGGSTDADPILDADGTWLSGCRWPTAEIAEQKALEDMRADPLPRGDKYLGPVFFPGEQS